MNRLRIVLILLLAFSGSLFSWPKKMVIIVPVADLRSECSVVTDLSHSKFDRKQYSQLLFGEKIIADKEVDGWLYVSAIDQEVYDNDKKDFIGCPGWIRSDQAVEVKNFSDYNLVVRDKSAAIWHESENEEIIRVLLGAELNGEIGEDDFFYVDLPEGKGRIKKSSVINFEDFDTDGISLRSSICTIATLFLSGPYTWGGRSIYDELLEKQGQLTGVDCSNLVALCYKICGMKIPRNTNSQYKKCTVLDFGKDLKPADLVFVASEGPLGYKIDHVMLYVGNDCFIESICGKIMKVVNSTGKERFGRSVRQLSHGDITDCGKVYLGTFFGI